MRKLLFTLFAATSIIAATAQNWSATITTLDGLPGDDAAYMGRHFYTFKSQEFTPGGTVDIIRITVTENLDKDMPNGNNMIFALSSLTVYDENGTEVSYTAHSNADYNAITGKIDGEGLYALNDKDIETYFHSMYGTPPVTEYHYIELALSRSVSAFSIEWTTRVGLDKDSPTSVGITLGTEYAPGSFDADFALGDVVTEENDLSAEKQFFVLKGNARTSFTASTGTTYTGSGPIYMNCAESGSKEATATHIMQLIPTGTGEYFVYWPASQKFLKDSHADYNSLNGWQYSTTNIKEAAKVKITSTGDGYFEMQYSTAYNNSPITFYIGAELRDNVVSKMKTFDLEHKQYLENGDYSQGFSLPIAFNWSIFKAVVDETTFDENALKMSSIANMFLASVINKAKSLLEQYGDFNGLCTNNEDDGLRSRIDESEALTSDNATSYVNIVTAKEQLESAIATYMSVKLDKYSNDINKLLAESEFSTFPNYVTGTYPESSRDILESSLETIANAKRKASEYSAEEFEAIYTQLDRDIELFNSTLITTGTGGGETEEDKIDENLIYVYLKNGNIDIYEISSIDGNHYTEGNKLYIPLKNDEVLYYTSEEYDSVSTIRPELPTMVSYKFNNKYNPGLFIDAVAANITNKINLSLNTIGKWLTASFTLSDDRAIAYVDTVPQVSKETRQSFANGVKYTVTYPGYNILRYVKIQDEVWREPSTGGAKEIQLTASMLSTNKPPREDEGFENLFDNDPYSMFHSTWGSSNYDASVNPHIEFDLPENVEMIQLYYMTRNILPSRNPTGFEIHVSDDGKEWNNVRTFTADTDGLPLQQPSGTFTTPTIDLKGSYSKIRLVQTGCEYSKNHLAFAELRLYEVEKASTDSVKLQDAIYEYRRIPYGNEYNVNINWLTESINKVPRIDIDIDGGETVTSKDYYLNAKFRITGFGVYESFEDSVQIKGRGNTTWGYPKKPYRLKFAEKVKPFGMTKGKNWVLLANYQTGSHMANAISMKIGQLSGAEYTNHIVPVELYINGRYMGGYMFTEKVGMANNSVDVDEETGYLLEFDTNYDEAYKFRTNSYSLPVNIKEPDLTEYEYNIAKTRLENIKRDINGFCDALAAGEEIQEMLDIEAFARFMLPNDLSLNQEINHPKSTFLFKENENDSNSKLKFGPIWDFDWGYGYEARKAYCYSEAESSIINYKFEAAQFIGDMISREEFKRHYYKLWKNFLNNNSIDELIDYIDCYYNFANSSFKNEQELWDNPFTEIDKERHKRWLIERKNHIYENLDSCDIDDLIYAVPGDVNCDNTVTILDAALITAHLNGNTDATMSDAKADCDKNGTIEIADARAVAGLIKSGDAPSAAYWYSKTPAAGEMYSNSFVLEMGDVETIQVKLQSYDEEQYKAIQFDVELPDGVIMIDVQGENALKGHNFSYVDKGDNLYRFIAYSDENRTFSTGDDAIVSLTFTATEIINEQNRKMDIKKTLAVDENNNELRIQDCFVNFSQTTGIGYTGTEMLIEGGECISITLLKAEEIAVYSVDGRKVHSVKAKEGTTRIEVPAGIYIVKGEKVVVR